MQAVLIIPEAEWRAHLARLDKLEAAEAARLATTTDADAHADEVLSTRDAAAHLGLQPDALLRARRTGKLQGVRLNEKDWGFRRRDLDKYPRRYHGAAQAQAA